MKNDSYKDKNIFLGLDVHKKSWDVRILTENTMQQQIHISPPEVSKLVNLIKGRYPGGNYLCAYEAGFSGFWLQEELESHGIKTLVVHAADIPTSDKDKRFKTDRQDCTKIAKALRAGMLQGIYCPDKQQQLDRSIVRQRYTLASDQRRVKNRIKAHLNFYGIEISSSGGYNIDYWSARRIKDIEQFAMENQHEALLAEIELLKNLRQAMLKAVQRIRALSKVARHAKPVAWLRSITGVGLLTAMVIRTEIGPIDRFKNTDQLASYVGIIPGIRASGEVEKSKYIVKRGNKRLRTTLIQSAWMAVRNDPKMALVYEAYKARGMNSQKAIIKISRKLLNRIWYVLKNECALRA